MNVLPPTWQKVSLFNPLVYLISGFRWSFYSIADVQSGDQPCGGVGFLRAVPGRDLVDLQDRLPAEELHRNRAVPPRPSSCR